MAFGAHHPQRWWNVCIVCELVLTVQTLKETGFRARLSVLFLMSPFSWAVLFLSAFAHKLHIHYRQKWQLHRPLQACGLTTIQHTSASLKVAGLKRFMDQAHPWLAHKGWCGTRERGWFRCSHGWNFALERRSRVRGSVVGPFSQVAFLLSCGEMAVQQSEVPLPTAAYIYVGMYLLRLTAGKQWTGTNAYFRSRRYAC